MKHNNHHEASPSPPSCPLLLPILLMAKNQPPILKTCLEALEELARLKRQEKEVDGTAETLRKTFAHVNTASTPVNTASPSRNITSLEDIDEVPNDGIFTDASYDDEGAVADFTNLESTVNVSSIPQYRIHSTHPTTQILRDLNSVVQTRSKVNKSLGAHAFTASTPIETKKPLVKDAEAATVDVTPKNSHLHAVKRIFRYLKGQLKLGLWHPRESAFDLEAYTDSDYAGANLDRKSTIEGCQFLGSYTDKVKVINAKDEGISAAGETLNAATLTDERKYTLTKETLKRMMALRLIVKSESEAA
uniref:Uncharacterized mitochondrial protein AtMg00810-like n=1 Tax=Tanacetum cinerariifolium TaxID=118510 RepID=A0A6L2MAL6_TANCI|nr:uncharacterized mitochondrial protein AtMg00810-like [Tanacetum cinerariifolium]